MCHSEETFDDPQLIHLLIHLLNRCLEEKT
jgi:hypothetical protein